jgi:hypothetical protein
MIRGLSSTLRALFFGLCFLGLYALVARDASAQVTTADIVGTALDASGAVVPNVTVTVENIATHQIRTAHSGGSGDYALSLLQPGPYSVTVEAAGFKTFKVPNLLLAAGDRVRADARLQIGPQTQTVEVSGASVALQTDSSTLSTVVTERAVQDLPLNGRNYITLVQNTPGANAGNPNGISSGTRPDDRRQTNAVSANGQAEAYNGNLIDGMDNNELEQGLIIVRPAIDAIQEVKVDTNAFTAELGRTAGAVINVITKSGTNTFHGSLYEFFRNDKLDANDYFSKQAALPRPEYRLNQFGGSLGGPIKRNKTFFFGDVEAYRIVQGAPTGLLTVPTLFEEQNPGDFSDIGGPVIPQSQLDAVALKYFALYPAPNVPGAGTTNNFSATPRRTQNSTTADLRIDQHFSANDSFFVRYSYNPVKTFTPGALPPVNGVQPGGITNFPGQNTTKAQGVQLNYVHIFSPNLLVELKAGYSRLNLQSLQLNYGTNAAEKFGMPNVNNFDHFNTGLSPVDIQGYPTLGDADYIPIVDVNNVFQYAGAVTYSLGSHDIKMGTGFIRRQLNYYQAVQGEGEFMFAGSQALATLLTGIPTTINRTNQLYTNYMRTTEPHVYLQDDWRATHSLTLNLGLRWDYFSPITNPRYQRSNFDINTLQLVIASPSNPTAGVQPDHKDFAPRFGFAQSLGRHTVLRGGFGLSFYNPLGAGSGTNLPNPPFSYGTFACQPGNQDPGLACPAGIGSLSQGPPFPTQSSITNLSGGLTAIPFNNRSSYVEQFNLTLQEQFGQNVVTASYVGELGRRQELGVNINQPLPAPGAQPPPFTYAAQLPNVSSILVNGVGGDSSYHALQLVFERRYSKGLVLNANYTYASNLNDFSDPSGGISAVQLVTNDTRYDWGPSDIAIRHRFALTADYELPFAKSATGLKRALLGGWQINTLSYWQTGLPFTVMDGAFASAPINLPGVTADRPNILPGQSFGLKGRSINEWFNIAAFTPQPQGTAGNEGRDQLWAPSTREIDASVFKQFPIRESWRLEFRAETYNLTNTENFASPNSSISAFDPVTLTPTQAGGFGQVSSTLLGAIPRQIQFALKLAF